MCPSEVVERDSSHRYTLGGVAVPGVTAVLTHAGICPPVQGDEWYLDRGRLVHRLTELDDEGTLVEESVDPALAPYLAAWRKFRAESRLGVVANEQLVGSSIFMFAGQLDRVMERGVAADSSLALVDLKTTAVPEWAGAQTAAYAQAYYETTGNIVKERLAVALLPNGTYRVQPFNPPMGGADWKLFASALYLWHYHDRRKKP